MLYRRLNAGLTVEPISYAAMVRERLSVSYHIGPKSLPSTPRPHHSEFDQPVLSDENIIDRTSKCARAAAGVAKLLSD